MKSTDSKNVRVPRSSVRRVLGYQGGVYCKSTLFAFLAAAGCELESSAVLFFLGTFVLGRGTRGILLRNCKLPAGGAVSVACPAPHAIPVSHKEMPPHCRALQPASQEDDINDFLKQILEEKKMKNQSKEGFKTTIIGSTLRKIGKMGST